MNKKGFVLAEAIVVAVFVLGMFTYLAMNVFPLVTKYIQATNYDNPNEVYLTNTLYDELVASNKFDTLEDGVYYFSIEDDEVKVKDGANAEINSASVFSQDYFKNMICKQLRVTSIVVTSDAASFDKTVLSRGMRQYYNYMQDHNELAGKKSLLLEFENTKYSSISKQIRIVEGVAKAQCFKISGTTITGWDTSKEGCETIPTNLVIPDEIDGKDVKEIGNNAFENQTNIKTVKFTDDITRIGNSAFQGCSLSGELDLPNSLTTIGSSAFQDNNISGHLEMPTGVGTVAEYSFQNNSIISLNLSNVTSIGKYAFQNNGIIELKLPVGLKTIAQSAFENNKISGELDLSALPAYNRLTSSIFKNNRIEKVILGANITIIDGSAFSKNRIKELIIDENSQLTTIGGSAFHYNQITGELKLPNTLDSLGTHSFEYNKITEIDFGDDPCLEEIPMQAFSKNEISGELNIPDSVRKINSYAFSNNKIESITIGENVELISSYAFSNNDINNVKLGKNLKRIEYGAFSNNQIQELLIPQNVEFIGGRNRPAFLGAFQLNKITKLEFEEGSKIREFEDCAFLDNALENVVIPGSISVIGAEVFSSNKNLATITIKKADATGLTLGENWNGNATVIYDPS